MLPIFATLAFAALASARPGGVSGSISPPSAAPAGCQSSYSGTFEITVVNVTSPAKRDLSKREPAGPLVITLSGGVLKDAYGRIGYIASNRQFQFDGPPQAGAIYTAGFSVCANGSIALGGSTIFYQCYSGGFFNLYDEHWAAQCSPIYIDVITAAPGPATVTQGGDGQPVATGANPPVSVKSDGQPVATAAGQPPLSEKSDGQPVATAAGAPPLSEKSDGQPVATAAAPPPLSEKSDGQPVATAAAPPPLSEKSDGQPVATAAAPAPPAVSEKSDGQPVATSAAVQTVATTSAPATFTGAAVPMFDAKDALLAMAGVIGAVALL